MQIKKSFFCFAITFLFTTIFHTTKTEIIYKINEAEKELEEIIRCDPGNRGIASFFKPGELSRAALFLLQAKKVVITTGFMLPTSNDSLRGVPETDGPPGAIAIGNALKKMGKEVLYVVDKGLGKFFEKLDATPCVELAISTKDSIEKQNVQALNFLHEFCPDVLLSIERPGRTADGSYRSMSAKDISHINTAIDALFVVAQEKFPDIVTIGIGDGGNEIGMGGLRDGIIHGVKHGEKIATTVPADAAIVAGVSNWGGYALVRTLEILNRRNDLLPTELEVHIEAEKMKEMGFIDGVTQQVQIAVDGLPLEKSLEVLHEMKQVECEVVGFNSLKNPFFWDRIAARLEK